MLPLLWISTSKKKAAGADVARLGELCTAVSGLAPRVEAAALTLLVVDPTAPAGITRLVTAGANGAVCELSLGGAAGEFVAGSAPLGRTLSSLLSRQIGIEPDASVRASAEASGASSQELARTLDAQDSCVFVPMVDEDGKLIGVLVAAVATTSSTTACTAKVKAIAGATACCVSNWRQSVLSGEDEPTACTTFNVKALTAAAAASIAVHTR
jgi:hypothetical protein